MSRNPEINSYIDIKGARSNNLKEVDLNLPQRTSREANYEANNKHPELDKPSQGVCKEATEKHGDLGIDTNADTKTLSAPADDPYLL